MRTRTWIGIFTLAGAIGAASAHDLAAFYAALGVGAILYVIHSIEVKVNRLLDHCRITVLDTDIADL